MFAVIPAEPLIAQAVILAACESAGPNDLGQVTITLVHPWAAGIALLVLLAGSAVLYVVGHAVAARGRQWHAPDWLRILIPPLALLVWAIAMPGSLMDAIWPQP